MKIPKFLQYPARPQGPLWKFAQEVRREFHTDVWLVGSALEHREPRDWDMRVVLPDHEFEARYRGRVPEYVLGQETGLWAAINHLRSRDCCAWSRRGFEETGLNVDFQVHPWSVWRDEYSELPRLLLVPAVSVCALHTKRSRSK